MDAKCSCDKEQKIETWGGPTPGGKGKLRCDREASPSHLYFEEGRTSMQTGVDQKLSSHGKNGARGAGKRGVNPISRKGSRDTEFHFRVHTTRKGQVAK